MAQTEAASVDPAKQELLQKARKHGWQETTAFDYDAFSRLGGNSNDWLGKAKIYEWSGEYGDVGPAIPELEKILFGTEHHVQEGAHREAIELEVEVRGEEKISPVLNFTEAGLHPIVAENVKQSGYIKPTPVQAYAIPAVLSGYDVVGIAQTGTGKTAAYLIPILHKLMGKAKKLAGPRPDVTRPDYDPRRHAVRAEPLAVIVVPTRELAIQIFDEARRMCYRSMLRPCVAYGGWSLGENIQEIGKGCDILIGTPGRIRDLMGKPDVLTMSRVKFTVIDEADEMLDHDWQEDLNTIMAGGDTNEDADHVYMMFSATFPKGARQLANTYMAPNYVHIRVGRPGQAHKNIRQNVIYVDRDQKDQACYDLLFQSEPGRTLIFCNSRPAVDMLDAFLYNKGLPSTSIHGDRNQVEREDAIRAFRTGRAPILIATSVSARGWDIKNVVHVINYDLPNAMYGGISEYVHRIGRTARIGNQGLATSFYNERDEEIAQALVNVLIECECEVPDFLSHLAPAGDGQLEFDDDTDDEPEGDDAGGQAWGGVAVDGDDGAPPVAAGDTSADQGFQADGGFEADGAAAATDW